MDFDGIIKGFRVVAISVAAIIAIFATAIIGSLLVGTVSEVAVGGDIPVSSAMNTSISGVEGTFISTNEKLLTIPGIIAGLVIIVVIGVIFGLGKLLKTKMGSNSGGSIE